MHSFLCDRYTQICQGKPLNANISIQLYYNIDLLASGMVIHHVSLDLLGIFIQATYLLLRVEFHFNKD